MVKFDEDQIQNFIQSWYSAVSEESDKNVEKAKTQSAELFFSISQNESVLKMASNPLLATIITLIHHQGGRLPEKRVALYDIATATFLENWVKQRQSLRASSFDKETLVSILAPISYYIHENYTDGLITETELKYLIRNEYQSIQPLSK